MAAVLTSIIGLPNLSNLAELRADFHALKSIDLSGLSNLTYIDLSDNQELGSLGLESINVSGCTSLIEMRLEDNNIGENFPDLSGLDNLTYLRIDDSELVGSVDISNLPALEDIQIYDNIGLTEVIISSSQPLGNGSNSFSNCALSQTSVDNILIALSENAIENGYVDLSGGTNSYPGALGESALEVLDSKNWSWDVNSAPLPPGGNIGIPASTDFDIVGNFTIEMFANLSNTDSPYPRTYSFGTWPAANAISIESGTIYFWANNANAMSASFSPTVGQWAHIVIMGSDTTLYMYINGIQVASGAYSGSISSDNLPLTIGYGNEEGSYFNGLMSNFRWSNTAVYSTSGFTVPTTPLTALPSTILLTLQGTDTTSLLLDNSGSGNNATGENVTYSTLNPFSGVVGSLQLGRI